MRRKGIGAVAVGAVLLIAAVTGFIVVPEHQPVVTQVCRGCGRIVIPGAPTVTIRTGLSQTMYDILRIATWALLIVGALTVVMGLIRYARPGSTLGTSE